MVPHTPTADANGKYPIDIEATSPTVKSMVLEMGFWDSQHNRWCFSECPYLM
jgi:hypothetical protein